MFTVHSWSPKYGSQETSLELDKRRRREVERRSTNLLGLQACQISLGAYLRVDQLLNKLSVLGGLYCIVQEKRDEQTAIPHLPL